MFRLFLPLDNLGTISYKSYTIQLWPTWEYMKLLFNILILLVLQGVSCSNNGRRDTLFSPWRVASWCVGMRTPLLTRWWHCRPTARLLRRVEKSSTSPGCHQGAGETVALPSSCRRKSSCCFSLTTQRSAGGHEHTDLHTHTKVVLCPSWFIDKDNN